MYCFATHRCVSIPVKRAIHTVVGW